MDDPVLDRPAVRMKPGESRRIRRGHPWAFSNELAMDAQARALAPGTVVRLLDAGDEALGVGTFNPHTLIAWRLFDRDSATEIDPGWLQARLGRALALRERLYEAPFYRLCHAEADGLPGLVVDRYGDVVVVQANTAGMERLTPAVVEALDRLLAPRVVVLRNDSPSRVLEGLEPSWSVARGTLDGPVPVAENGVTFLADLTEGQKTGWFFDQRDNRAFVARLARGGRMLDVYAYTGGFGLAAAAAGAEAVLLVDRSEPALRLAGMAAAANGLDKRVTTRRGEAFAEMERMAAAGERFDAVACDPPAFVKSRKDLKAGAKGYRKVARLAAPLVAPGGILFVASCSHHMPAAEFLEEVARGLQAAGRSGRILRLAGAGPDHPVLPDLPESAYLKSATLQLD